MLGALVDLHSLEADANSSRGDDDNSVAILSQLECSVHNQGKNGQKRLMSPLVHDGARPFTM